MTICYDCAINKGLIGKNKQVGVWSGTCPYCKEPKALCDEIHDYRRPGQKPVTLEDLYLYECNNLGKI